MLAAPGQGTGTDAPPQRPRWKVIKNLPGNPISFVICTADGGDVLGAVVRALTMPGVSTDDRITLEREVLL